MQIRTLLLGTRALLVGDLILAEVLEGFSSEADGRRALNHFEPFEFRNIGGREIAIAAARNYRFLQKNGVTVRSTTDMLIATFCIREAHELLHCARDFHPFEHYLGLRVIG